MILFILVCRIANADSINSFSGVSASRFGNAEVPLHQYAAGLTGFRPFFGPSLWNDPRHRTIPVGFVHSTEWRLPQHTSLGNQTLDLFVYFFRHLVDQGPHPRAANRTHR